MDKQFSEVEENTPAEEKNNAPETDVTAAPAEDVREDAQDTEPATAEEAAVETPPAEPEPASDAAETDGDAAEPETPADEASEAEEDAEAETAPAAVAGDEPPAAEEPEAEPERKEAPDAAAAETPPLAQKPPKKKKARRVKRKRESGKRKVAVGWIIAAALLVVLALGAISLNFIIKPEDTANRFVTAMRLKDVKMLSSVAETANGETKFDARNTAPMFELYDDNESFREEIIADLTADARLLHDGKAPMTDNIVDIRSIDCLLFRLYKVVVADTEATVYTNFKGAKVSLEGNTKVAYATSGYEYNTYGFIVSDDYFNLTPSKAVFSGLLPGSYRVRVEYLSSFGDTYTAEGQLDYGAFDGGYELNVDFESMEISNLSDFAVEVSLGEKGTRTLEAGEVYRLFPLHAGELVSITCDTGNELSVSKTLVAGEDDAFAISFAALTVDSPNMIPISYFVNGTKAGTVPADAAGFRIYPLNMGDEVTFEPDAAAFLPLLEPMSVTLDQEEQQTVLDFKLLRSAYEGVDDVIKQDILESFDIINRAYTMDELKDLVLLHPTLAELIDYADYETAGVYATLSSPEIAIDLEASDKAHLVDLDAVKMCIDAELSFSVAYHEKDKDPVETVEKDVTLTYTLAYKDGAWAFEPAENLVV